jgi:hypothetical protein
MLYAKRKLERMDRALKPAILSNLPGFEILATNSIFCSIVDAACLRVAIISHTILYNLINGPLAALWSTDIGVPRL